MRESLAAKLASRLPGHDFSFVRTQRGMFSYSGLDQGAGRAPARRVSDLRGRHRPHLRRSAQFPEYRPRRGRDRRGVATDCANWPRRPLGREEPRWYTQQPVAGIAQLVERNLAKVEVASSRLVSRSRFSRESLRCDCAALPFRLTGCCRTISDGTGRDHPGRGGRVVMQRPAKPSTPVRFRPPPPTVRALPAEACRSDPISLGEQPAACCAYRSGG